MTLHHTEFSAPPEIEQVEPEPALDYMEKLVLRAFNIGCLFGGVFVAAVCAALKLGGVL